MPTLRVDSIGDYIRDQRRNASISLRQLADLAGVSNPYLSQIERGLRHPSAEILQQIAKGLRISAETLYVRAGILEERSSSPEVTAAIHGDHGLTERQKRVLIDIYETFRRENSAADVAAGAATPADAAHRATRRAPARASKRAASHVAGTAATHVAGTATERATDRAGARVTKRASKRASASPAPTPVRRSHPKT